MLVHVCIYVNYFWNFHLLMHFHCKKQKPNPKTQQNASQFLISVAVKSGILCCRNHKIPTNSRREFALHSENLMYLSNYCTKVCLKVICLLNAVNTNKSCETTCLLFHRTARWNMWRVKCFTELFSTLSLIISPPCHQMSSRRPYPTSHRRTPVWYYLMS